MPVVRMPDQKLVRFPDDMPREQIRAFIDERFPEARKPMREMGTSAAEDDPFGISTAGMEVPTERYADAMASKFMQGPTFGLGEEIGAAARTGYGKLEKALTGETELGDYSTELARGRAELAAIEKDSPGLAAAAEMTGAMASPAAYARLPQMLQKGGRYGQAAIRAGLGGFAYGAGKGEGVEGRLEEGAKTAALAVPFALGFQGLGNQISKKLAAKAAVADELHTAASLKNTAKEAYKAADMEKTFFGPSQMKSVQTKTSNRLANDLNYIDGDAPQVDKVLRRINRRVESKKPISLDALDDLRQYMWGEFKVAKRAGDDNQMKWIRGIIDDLDEVVDTIPGTSAKLQAARQAWKQSQKAERLESFIDQAELKAFSSGSGGNVTNMYLKAVGRLLNDPKQAQFFTPEERRIMEEFIRTGAGGRMMRSLSKLSPNGNGMMLALHAFSAAAIDPTTLAAAGVGMAAQRETERRVKQGVQEIINAFGGTLPKKAEESRLGTAAGIGTAGQF